METTHIQKYLHTSPRKLRLVADMVRNMNPVKALEMLAFTPKAASDDLAKAIQTALGNAKQKGLDASQLGFKNLEINESMKMRRFRAGTRGRAKPYRKKMSHIKIVLSDDLNIKSQKSNVKTATKNLKVEKEKGGKQTEVVVDNSADSAK